MSVQTALARYSDVYKSHRRAGVDSNQAHRIALQAAEVERRAVKLTDLDPQMQSAPPLADGAFNFICPACRKGRVIVHVVLGELRPDVHAHAVNALPPAWDEMTITPSIADEGRCSQSNRGCPGWHGFITEGRIV